jgi:hypothetical protein
MIFSFSDSLEKEVDFNINQTDVFCFFHSENSVSLPDKYWLQAIASSLKLKKNVLILESHFTLIQNLNISPSSDKIKLNYYLTVSISNTTD